MSVKLLREARLHGLAPDPMTYFHTMKGLQAGGDWVGALGMLEEMRGARMLPDEITYNLLIAACQDVFQWEIALGLLDDMKSDGVTPSTVACTSLITACEKASVWERAVDIFEGMRSQDMDLNVITFTAVISAFGRGGRWADALRTLHMMQEEEVPNILTYAAVVAACANAGMWDVALRVQWDMEKEGIKPHYNVYVHLVHAAAQAGEWEWVYYTLDELHREYGGVGANEEFNLAGIYGVLIAECARRGEFERGLAFMSDMHRLGVQPDMTCIDAALSICEASGMDFGTFTERAMRDGYAFWYVDVRDGAMRNFPVIEKRANILMRYEKNDRDPGDDLDRQGLGQGSAGTGGNWDELFGQTTSGLDLLAWHGFCHKDLDTLQEKLVSMGYWYVVKPFEIGGSTVLLPPISAPYGHIATDALQRFDFLPGKWKGDRMSPWDLPWLPRARRALRLTGLTDWAAAEEDGGARLAAVQGGDGSEAAAAATVTAPASLPPATADSWIAYRVGGGRHGTGGAAADAPLPGDGRVAEAALPGGGSGGGSAFECRGATTAAEGVNGTTACASQLTLEGFGCGRPLPPSQADAVLGAAKATRRGRRCGDILNRLVEVLGIEKVSVEVGARLAPTNTGEILLYMGRAPCTACLAAFVQFKTCYPEVQLQVAFGGAREEARWRR